MAFITISHEKRRVLVGKPKSLAGLSRLAKEIFKLASDDVHLAIDFIDSRGNKALAELHESSYSILKDNDATFLIVSNQKDDENKKSDAVLTRCSSKFSSEAEQKAEKTLEYAYSIDEASYEWKRMKKAKTNEQETKQKERLARWEDANTDEADYDPYTDKEGYGSAGDEVFYKWDNAMGSAAKSCLHKPEEAQEEKPEEAAGIEDQLDHEEAQMILEPLFADAEAQETFAVVASCLPDSRGLFDLA